MISFVFSSWIMNEFHKYLYNSKERSSTVQYIVIISFACENWIYSNSSDQFIYTNHTKLKRMSIDKS
jgi:hypothetical protein